jgi:quercetin dioxygenase-like cupin family protein
MKKLWLFSSLISITAFAKAEVHVGQPQVTYVQPYGAQGPSFGFVEGKFGDKKPASFFLKMSAGGDSGWHTHDEDYSAVVIAGTFSEQQQGDDAESLLPVGSYFTQPGKKVHRNGCLKGTDCLIFVHFDKGASSTPTSRDGKPLPPPK